MPKIREALNFMRNHSFEVPFIANYRKEYVEPELDVHDLWTIWQSDEKVRKSGLLYCKSIFLVIYKDHIKLFFGKSIVCEVCVHISHWLGHKKKVWFDSFSILWFS